MCLQSGSCSAWRITGTFRFLLNVNRAKQQSEKGIRTEGEVGGGGGDGFHESSGIWGEEEESSHKTVEWGIENK